MFKYATTDPENSTYRGAKVKILTQVPLSLIIFVVTTELNSASIFYFFFLWRGGGKDGGRMGEHKFKLNMALQSILGSVKTKPFWDWGGKGGMLPDLTCDPCFKTAESMFFHP